MADAMVRDGVLTHFQADQLLKGKWRNFKLSDKYKLLEKIGKNFSEVIQVDDPDEFEDR